MSPGWRICRRARWSARPACAGGRNWPQRRPDLQLVEFRGNVQTRMKKLEDGVAVATFLAMAGLNRLGMADVARSAIEADEMLPAVAQGAIGIERRLDDTRTGAMLAAIHHTETGCAWRPSAPIWRRWTAPARRRLPGWPLLDGDGAAAAGRDPAPRRIRGDRRPESAARWPMAQPWGHLARDLLSRPRRASSTGAESSPDPTSTPAGPCRGPGRRIPWSGCGSASPCGSSNLPGFSRPRKMPADPHRPRNSETGIR